MSYENSHLPETQTDKTDKTLAGIATRYAAICTQAYEVHRAKLDADLESAARDKGGLPDGYWKPVHSARLKAMAANALLAAIMEAGQDG